MPAFLVILVIVILVSWLGWWLLAIFAGIALAVGLVILWKRRHTAAQYAPVGLPAKPLDNPGEPAKTIRIEIKSMSFVHDTATTSRRISVSQPNSSHPTVALVIKDGPLEQILAGTKTWEMRAQHTRKRETVALAKRDQEKSSELPKSSTLAARLPMQQ